MEYYFSKKVDTNFQDTIELVTKKLKEKGFGVLTEIDVQATLKNKIGVDFYKYIILGACNPHFAHKALIEEDKVGVMLPCNVIIQQKDPNQSVEISAVDPLVSMSAIKNNKLATLAHEVQILLKSVIKEI